MSELSNGGHLKSEFMRTGKTFLDWLHRLELLLPLTVGVLLAVSCAVALTLMVLTLLNWWFLLREKMVFLELTPPANFNKKPEATQRLFAMLHGLEASRPWAHKLLRRKVSFALEIVSTETDGIRYILRVPTQQLETFERMLASYSTATKFKRVDEDFLQQSPDYTKLRILDFKQMGHFAYPLNTQLVHDQHDPMAYITGAMTKLSGDEMMAFQLVVTPTQVREAGVIANRLVNNSELVYRLGKRKLPMGKFFDLISSFLFEILDGIGELVTPTSSSYGRHSNGAARKYEVAARLRPARQLSAIEQALADSVNNKLQQPLFEVSVRAMAITEDKQQLKQRGVSIRNALDGFKMPKRQGLKARMNLPWRLWAPLRLFMFKHRLPALLRRNSCILSAAEVADLYHFPHSETAKTENVIKSLSKTLPAPVSLKGSPKLDVILGQNIHQGTITNIGLLVPERERHVYLIGSTGSGKSTMMEYAIMQDIKAGKGVAFIDPHGDSAQKILRNIPPDRMDDVVYFNPVDIKYPIGLNFLELPEGLDEDQMLLEKERVTEAVVSVMRKVFSDDKNEAHRIEGMLRNAIHTAFTVKDATLFTVLKLLRSTQYRKRIVAKLDDQDLKDYWREEVGQAGNMQRVSMSKGLTMRIDRFRISPSARRVLEQPKSTINFEDIINSGKILICNIADVGEDTAALFGTTILAELKMAAERRSNIPAAQRRPFYLYVDEFQNFATTPFIKMLSGARKYKLFLTLAEQSTAQQETQRMTEAILANVSTIICFRTGSPADERLLLSRFDPYIELGEMTNLPVYNFYARLSAITPQEPVSGITIVPDEGSEDTAQQVIAAPRANYAIEYNSKKPKRATQEDADDPVEDKSGDADDDFEVPQHDAPATA